MASEEFLLPSEAAAMRVAVNKTAKRSKTITVPDDQKLAIVVLPLQPAIEPAQFPALKALIEGLSGVQVGVSMVVHGTTRPSVAEGYEQILVTEVHLRTRAEPEEP